MRFIVTTPVYNGEQFLDEAILSVVSQAGAFSIRYHVQDGGSNDGTLAKLEAWRVRLNNDFPILCENVQFTYSSSSDVGVYDAVNRGFEACGDGDVMTWINSDDRIEAGCFSSVKLLLSRFQTIKWLCGRGALMDEAGSVMVTRPMLPFAQSAIMACIFDGRYNESFLMQEGSFWRPEVWRSAGPLDVKFRLAGDFDLWRRFAQVTDLVVIDSTFGYFRSRKGQLSENIDAYWAELDAGLPTDIRRGRKRASRRYMLGPIVYRVATRVYKQDWVLKRISGLKIGKQILFSRFTDE